MADCEGQQIGNYRLIRMLGRGAFADVYLGQHIHLNTEAAVKVSPYPNHGQRVVHGQRLMQAVSDILLG